MSHARARYRRRAASLGAVLCFLIAGVFAGPGVASAAVSRSFFGVQDWATPSQQSFDRLAGARVGVLRVNFSWRSVEPSRGVRNWAGYDQLVARAARARMEVLPVLLGSPSFAARRAQHPPRSSAMGAWTAFVADAVRRYGPTGSFWAANPTLPRRPMRRWQVWNEPSLPVYWGNRPSARSYLRFLSRTRRAVKGVDRRAKIVLAGLPETGRGVSMQRYLRGIYRARGRRLFDVVALHPYARDQRGVEGAVKRTRRLMGRYRDSRKTLWITEFGWATGGRVSRNTRPFITNSRGQATRLSRTVRMLTRKRRRYRVGMVVWFALRDRLPTPGEPNWWAIHTGLFDRFERPKRSWGTFSSFTRRTR